jgi:hypothetical protein
MDERNWEIIMDERFDEWAASSTAAVVRRWGQTLIDAGVTWETFDRSDEGVVEDLISVKIPRIAARDVVNVVKQSRDAALHKATRPMAVFWDIENIQIPRNMTASETVERIKSKLVRLGPLSDIRAYTDGGLNTIPEEKRRELQQSGVHILDTPHIGAKEVADKMIIVDAMEFAYKNLGGATLVFITGDTDFAYMLARLQQPQWRTVVIARGSMRSMLHMNASTTLRWDTDIIGAQLRAESTTPHLPNSDSRVNSSAFPRMESDDGTATTTEGGVLLDDDADYDGAESLTDREMLNDDMEVLRNIVRQLALASAPLPPRKCDVGGALRTQNPLRFSNRDLVREALATAIERGVLIESGDGPGRRVAVVEEADTDLVLTLTDNPPLSALQLPEKAQRAASSRPFVLAVLKSRVPPMPNFAGAFVSATPRYMFLQFRSDFDAERFAQEHPYVRGSVFFNYRRHMSQTGPADTGTPTNWSLTLPAEALEKTVRLACQLVAHHCTQRHATYLVRAQLINNLISSGVDSRELREQCLTEAVQRGLLSCRSAGSDFAYSPTNKTWSDTSESASTGSMAESPAPPPPPPPPASAPPKSEPSTFPDEQLSRARTALLEQLQFLENNDELSVQTNQLLRTTSDISAKPQPLVAAALRKAIAEGTLVELQVGHEGAVIAFPRYATVAMNPERSISIDETLLTACFDAMVARLRAALPSKCLPRTELREVLRQVLPPEMNDAELRKHVFTLGSNRVPPLFKAFRRDDLRRYVVCLPENFDFVRATFSIPSATAQTSTPPPLQGKIAADSDGSGDA